MFETKKSVVKYLLEETTQNGLVFYKKWKKALPIDMTWDCEKFIVQSGQIILSNTSSGATNLYTEELELQAQHMFHH